MKRQTPSFGWFLIAAVAAAGYCALMVWWGVNALGAGHGSAGVALAIIVGVPAWMIAAILLVWDQRGTAQLAVAVLCTHMFIAFTIIANDWNYAVRSFRDFGVPLVGTWVLGQIVLWWRIIAVLRPHRERQSTDYLE